MKEYLFLFDIDGTMMDARGDGRKSLTAALSGALNMNIDGEFDLLGGIDYAIFSSYFERSGIPEKEKNNAWKLFQKEYLALMNKTDKTGWIIYPNVLSAVKYLHAHSNTAIVTGNIPEGAFLKLANFGLDPYFPCGRFGDNAVRRCEIVEEAIARAEREYRRKFERTMIFLFGDTLKDVESAVECGITPVLIDNKNQNRENASEWKVPFYGDFRKIDLLIEHIRKGTGNDMTIFL